MIIYSEPATVAGAMAVFKVRHSIDDSRLAEWLGVAPTSLPHIGSYPCPSPGHPSFVAVCSSIAEANGCDGWALREMLLGTQW